MNWSFIRGFCVGAFAVVAFLEAVMRADDALFGYERGGHEANDTKSEPVDVPIGDV